VWKFISVNFDLYNRYYQNKIAPSVCGRWTY